MIKIVAVIGLCVALAACEPPIRGVDAETAPNGFNAELLGTVDGCRIWRIKDWRYVYFARCPEGAVDTAASYEECTTSGKTTTCTVYDTTLLAGRTE